MAVAIGGMFAIQNAVFTHFDSVYLCDKNMTRLTDENGNRLILEEESPRFPDIWDYESKRVRRK